MRQLPLILLVFVVAGCGHSAAESPAASPATRPADEQAVFQAVFDGFLSKADPGIQWHFLAIPKKADPSPELQASLQKYGSVAPISTMKFELFPKHRVDGGRGVLIQIDEVKWIDATHVSVEAAYISGNQGGQGWRLDVKKVGDRWQVVKRDATWVS